MIHYQAGVDGLNEAVAKLPQGSLVKSVNDVQYLREAKLVNPKIITCFRYWHDDLQKYSNNWEAMIAKWRDIFPRFVNDTFRSLAGFVDYIEEDNEYLANSQSQEEIDARLLSARAALWVWDMDYKRVFPELTHIKLVICNTAVGNDISDGFAKLWLHFPNQFVMGYHPYTKWVNKARDPGDWEFLSGRWATMDARWRSMGLKIPWMFTEAGPYESAETGWRSSICLDADRDLYVEAVRQWIRDVKTTQAWAEKRVLGFGLFTTGRTDNAWKHFWTEQPELNMLANMVAEEWQGASPPPPPPDPVECRGHPREQYARTYNVIPQDATEERAVEIFLEGWRRSKETSGGSYDDAGIGDLDRRTANLYDIPPNEHDKFSDWFGDNYPGVKVNFYNGGVQEPPINDIVDELSKHPTKKYATRSLDTIDTIVIHHTVSPPDRTIESIASYHVNGRGYPGIAYHYVVTYNAANDESKIFQTNYLTTVSFHTYGQNNHTVGVALQGDFTDGPPPQVQQDSARAIVRSLTFNHGWGVGKHRDYVQTACPGNSWNQWFDYVAGN